MDLTMTRPIVVQPTVLFSFFVAWTSLLVAAFLLGLRLAG
jgi:hypothetical protein